MAGTCECGNEPSGSIKCDDFFFRLAENRLASQEGLCSMERVRNSDKLQFCITGHNRRFPGKGSTENIFKQLALRPTNNIQVVTMKNTNFY